MATTTRTNGSDSPGSPTRLPVLGPLHTPGSLAPLEYLQLTQRRGSISDHLLQASSTSLPENPRSTRQSFSFPPKMHSDHHHHWSQSESPVDDPRTPTSVPPSSTFLPPPAYSGTKRKMSHDRHTFAYPDDPHPPYQQGYSQQQDTDGPLPKRRGSTFETGNRIAHLSLQDRRDSIDSRSSISAASIGGWGADRRDSAASMYSTTSIGSSVSGGYSTASANDQQQPPQQQKPYPWSSQQPSSQPQDSPPQDPSAPSRNFSFPDQQPTPSQQQQSNPLPPSTHAYTVPPAPIPSIHYAASAAAARRLSIPDLSLNGIKPRRRASRSAAVVTSESASSNTDNLSESGERSMTPGGDTHMNPAASPTGGQGPASGDTSGSSLASPQFVNSLQAHTPGGSMKETPYSRSPELRVSHKLAERKRRKEMKELFDELRDQLPADRGMKASKWEILSKAVDYISQLKVAYTDMSTEIERLRRELDSRSPGMPTHQHPIPPLSAYISPPSQQQAPPTPHSQGGTPSDPTQPLPPVQLSHPPHSPMDATPSLPPHHRPGSGGGLSARHSPFATPTPQQPTQPLPAQGA